MLTNLPNLDKTKASVLRKIFLGIEPTTELVAILIIYFVQGMLALSRLAVSFFMKDDLLLSPAQVAAISGITAIPWMIKPFFGFISDSFPVLGYRRRSYLILAGLLGSLAWLSLATVVNGIWTTTIAVTLGSLGVALSDVIADSIVVERARGESQANLGSLQSLCWGSVAIGGLLTAYLSGWLLGHFSPRTVFAITIFLPLIISIVAFLIAEQPIIQGTVAINSFKQQLVQLKEVIRIKEVWLPTAFILIWDATPTSDSAFFYFLTNELHYEPEFLGRVRLVASLANLLGVWVFQRFLKSVPFSKIFFWGIIFSTALGLTALLLVTHTNRLLGINDQWFSIGDTLILTVAGEIVFMPVLVLAAKLSPPGIEATFFAILMSVHNLGGFISRELGALITYWLGITETKFDYLWLLLVITNLSNLLPLFLINWLKSQDSQSPEQHTAS
jgi:folate/biopterin transporter